MRNELKPIVEYRPCDEDEILFQHQIKHAIAELQGVEIWEAENEIIEAGDLIHLIWENGAERDQWEVREGADESLCDITDAATQIVKFNQ